MKSLLFIFTIVVLFNYIINVYAENDYYMVSIKSHKNHKNYDDESKSVQRAIDVLVNERLNDIYDIIEENKDTYILENGQMDEKLKELDSVILKKRNNKNNENTKLFFINNLRQSNIINFQKNIHKRSDNSTENLNDKVEYIPVDSKLVSPMCPVGKNYAVSIYASEEVIEEVKKLPNIAHCEKSLPSENHFYNYYSFDRIQKETNWTEVFVQEHNPFYGKNLYSHLSLLSQTRFNEDNTQVYDNNYYFPGTAGQGIDIYVIEEGVNFYNNSDYDTYKGTSYERTVSCDAIIENHSSIIPIPKNDTRSKNCFVSNPTSTFHGNIVNAMAGGNYFGVAKKANIHVIATTLHTDPELAALDFIKLNAKDPHKTIINLSRGGYGEAKLMQEKFTELKNKGFIIFVSAGNNYRNCCSKEWRYGGFDDVITVGATNGTFFRSINDGYNLAYYSNYGPCIDILAPGEVAFQTNEYYYAELDGIKFAVVNGTSYSSPIVAGVAATIMSEHPEIEYNYDLMKKTLINMSLKNKINGLISETPNRFINNGKRVIYSPVNTYNGCGESSGNFKCSKGCCSSHDKCINFEGNSTSYYCLKDNGCQNEFSEFCLTEKNKTNYSFFKSDDKCGSDYGSCIEKSQRYYNNKQYSNN
ncbi:subtilisin-like protein [Anaeromyces robustus]|uniref:Subtilisin-like protein n=1 Tax=Anaeromyces robustus TaxID=1754192 RepID=A0A1Y1WZT0_9FUNG|nr:subtilisin-like protein [Anaeromyces robustus]|eukprot:ORX79050.1 subtilisin-like protein [Anaeromyces robustus]